METALIIMIHPSVPFTVKAGKAATVSVQESACIHHQLYTYIYHTTQIVAADKFVFSNEESKDSVFFKSGYRRRLQRGRTQEAMMQHAFQTVFNMGYKKVVMLSGVSIETDAAQIQNAFDSLDSYDVVIGPAQQGSYYLLGMKAMHNFLFESKMLKHPLLLQDALKHISDRGLSYHLQPVLNNAEEANENYLMQHRQ